MNLYTTILSTVIYNSFYTFLGSTHTHTYTYIYISICIGAGCVRNPTLWHKYALRDTSQIGGTTHMQINGATCSHTFPFVMYFNTCIYIYKDIYVCVWCWRWPKTCWQLMKLAKMKLWSRPSRDIEYNVLPLLLPSSAPLSILRDSSPWSLLGSIVFYLVTFSLLPFFTCFAFCHTFQGAVLLWGAFANVLVKKRAF